MLECSFITLLSCKINNSLAQILLQQKFVVFVVITICSTVVGNYINTMKTTFSVKF